MAGSLGVAGFFGFLCLVSGCVFLLGANCGLGWDIVRGCLLGIFGFGWWGFVAGFVGVGRVIKKY